MLNRRTFVTAVSTTILACPRIGRAADARRSPASTMD
jgi:hypothetical protein